MTLAIVDIISWNAQISMSGAYRGSIRLTNQRVQYTENTLIWRPVAVGIEAIADTIGVALPDCFSGFKLWINGVVHAAKDDITLSARHIDVEVRSYFEQLKRKALSTELFGATNTNTPLDRITDEYLGIPSGLLDIVLDDPNRFNSIVNGNDSISELTKIAQSGEAELFIQTDGVLTAEHWKDHNSAVDVIIPNEAVTKVTKNIASAVGPTRVTVRGSYISEFECGNQTLTVPNGEEPCEDQDHKSAEDQGKVFRATCIGLGRPHVKNNIKNIKGSKEDLQNAALIVDGDCSAGSEYSNPRQPLGDKYEGTVAVDDGEISALLTDSCQGFLDPGEHLFKVRVVGKHRHHREHTDANTRRKNTVPGQTKNLKFAQNMLVIGSGVRGARLNDVIGGVQDSDKTADSKESTRIEMEVIDDDLAAEFGTISEQIDNEYIADHETLFDVAIRRFQEFKMSRKTWSVETVYLPCLQLNQKVQFVSPDNNEIVSGLLTDITINYDADKPLARMTLVIQSFELIGNTEYESGNLLRYPELCGANGVDWILTGDAHFFGCFAVLFAGSVLRQIVWLEVDAVYTVTAELKKKSGGSITTSVGLVNQVCTATCSVNFTFTATTIISTLQFSSSGEWILKEPKLTKRKTA